MKLDRKNKCYLTDLLRRRYIKKRMDALWIATTDKGVGFIN